MGDKTFVIVNGSSLLDVNFGLMMMHFRFLASSQTLCPLTKGLKPLWEWEDMTCRASSWAVRASLRAAERVFRRDSTAGMEVSEITEGRAQGSYPIMR